MYDICILQRLLSSSLGALIKAVLKLSICILQPVWALHWRCWPTVPGKILVSTMDTLHQGITFYIQIQATPLLGPSAGMNTHEHLLSQPKIRVWVFQLLTGGCTILRSRINNNIGDNMAINAPCHLCKIEVFQYFRIFLMFCSYHAAH